MIQKHFVNKALFHSINVMHAKKRKSYICLTFWLFQFLCSYAIQISTLTGCLAYWYCILALAVQKAALKYISIQKFKYKVLYMLTQFRPWLHLYPLLSQPIFFPEILKRSVNYWYKAYINYFIKLEILVLTVEWAHACTFFKQ